MTTMYCRGFFFALIFSGVIFADTTLVDGQLNYSIYLPSNWIREAANDSQHFFIDTTYTYPGQLSDTSLYH